MKVRRRARVIALQTLFEVDSVSHPAERVFAQRLADKEVGREAQQFAHDLVQGVLAHRVRLDGLIHEMAPEWPLSQMAIVDRNILRIALYEIIVESKTPSKVAINEAVELAKLFGSDSSSRFVNGVLGTYMARSDVARAATSAA